MFRPFLVAAVSRLMDTMIPSLLPQRSHIATPTSRREFLRCAGAGFGGLALAALLAREASAGTAARCAVVNPLAPRPPHLPARARSVIFCFMDGGPSHLDLFDPKPQLKKLAGKPLPASFPRPMTAMGSTANTPLLESARKFKQHGKSGLWVSDWYPEIAGCVDDLAVIRSCRADGQTHVASVSQMNTGSLRPGRPALGAWSLYGLGTACDNLPGFVILTDYDNDPPGGDRNWSTGFMPATYQGTKFTPGKTPILYANPPANVAEARQRSKVDYINELNRRYSDRRETNDSVEARIAAYELAYRMQSSAPDAVDLSGETAQTQRLYGMDRPETARNGRNCLLARRLVERGVRFVQLYMGSGSKWDAHSDLDKNHAQSCLESDRPIAGLLKDLQRRGLLDSTLVVWGGEFGRTPMSESGNGRDHNPFGFTMWMAGGGVKGGIVHGTTDEIGLYAVEKPAHIHDIHATILHLLGLDHKKLTFLHDGRDERLTETSGKVIEDILR
ncbi:MAG TPA: DUF1501 domain-containing protein [Gemmataceae bacterium]|nr:DUF1501 domain-containing protein [Gemmataceae bacterium]